MKCSLGISNFLEEISSLSHSIIFLYFFALITEEGFLISPSYSLELYIQMLISFLFSFAFCFSSFHSYLLSLLRHIFILFVCFFRYVKFTFFFVTSVGGEWHLVLICIFLISSEMNISFYTFGSSIFRKSGGGGLVTKWCPTLVTPWTVVCQAPLFIGFFRQEYRNEL